MIETEPFSSKPIEQEEDQTFDQTIDQMFGVRYLSYKYPRWDVNDKESFNFGSFSRPIGLKSQDYLDGLVSCVAICCNFDRELMEKIVSITSSCLKLNLDAFESNHLGICMIRPMKPLPDLGKIRNRDQLLDFLLETTEEGTIPEEKELQFIALVPFYRQTSDRFSPFGLKDDSYFKVYYGSRDFLNGLFDGFSWLNYPIKPGKILDLSDYSLVDL